jgi:hypothetical protein
LEEKTLNPEPRNTNPETPTMKYTPNLTADHMTQAARIIKHFIPDDYALKDQPIMGVSVDEDQRVKRIFFSGGRSISCCRVIHISTDSVQEAWQFDDDSTRIFCK